MNQRFKTAMLAAAQLTAAGNLNAATAAIQRALAGDVPAAQGASDCFAGASQAWSSWRDEAIDIDARWLTEDRQPGAGRAGLKSAGWAAGRPATEAKEQPEEAAPAKARSAHEAGRTIAGSFSASAGSRDYLLYLPAGAPASVDGRPLVVMLHGCTQTPADFAAGTAMNALADRHGFLVLYPAQSKSANQSACWNWFNPRDQRADAGEPSILAGMVREVLARHDGNPALVHVAGLSAGGAMAAILANAYPDLFASVAVHSGLKAGAAKDLSSALSAMKRGAAPDGAASGASAFAGSPLSGSARPVRTIVFHGRQDRTVHPLNGSQVVAAALAPFSKDELVARKESGRSPGGRSFTRTVHVDDQGRPMVEQWEVQGAGHAWSGGSAAGSYTDPIGPDASAAMVDFFFAR